MQADRGKEHINSRKMFKADGKDCQNLQLVCRKLKENRQRERRRNRKTDRQVEIVGRKEKKKKGKKKREREPTNQTVRPSTPSPSLVQRCRVSPLGGGSGGGCPLPHLVQEIGNYTISPKGPVRGAEIPGTSDPLILFRMHSYDETVTNLCEATSLLLVLIHTYSTYH